jgi:heme-degrading monooxygenase HmoA
MICRICTGSTTHANADAFEALVRDEIFPSMLAKNVPGFREIQLLRLTRPGQTEFLILKWFDDLDAIRLYAGDDYERSMYPSRARELLRRFEPKAEHYEVKEVTLA